MKIYKINRKDKRKVGVIIQCRQSSSRLNKKLLLPIGKKKVIDIVLDRVKKIDSDIIICAVAKEIGNNNLIKAIKKNNVEIYEGSKNNVLLRYYKAAKKFKVKTIIRITSDCPLIDPFLVNIGIKIYKRRKLDHLCNNLPPTWPHGLDYEIFDFDILEQALKKTLTPYDKEHVTPSLRSNNKIKRLNIKNSIKLSKYYRWTLDTKLDYLFLRKLFKLRPKLYFNFDWRDLHKYLNNKKNLQSINTSSHHFYFKQ